MNSKQVILTISIASILLICTILTFGGLIYWQLSSQLESSNSSSSEATSSSTSSLQGPPITLVDHIQTCKDITLETKDGNIFLTKDGESRMLNEGLEADPEDFREGWIFVDAKFIFDCSGVIAHQRYNFTTGGGFHWVTHVFPLDDVAPTSFQDGSMYVASENGEYVVIDLGIGDQRWLNADYSLTPILSEDTIYTPANRLASAYYQHIITNHGTFIAQVYGEDFNGEWYILTIKQDGTVKVIDTFPQHDLYYGFSAYDDTTETYTTGNCRSPINGKDYPEKLIMDCSEVKVYIIE